MRNAFADEVTRLAAIDKRIVLLSGDIGNRLFNPYQELFPERFYNCGVAEANMMSMAGGLALCGLRPIVYTITPFVTTRCLEQIRLDVCHHNVPVIIVGVGAGFSYASLNPTHHSCEDIAFLRMLPNMTIICPGDAWEVRLALRAALEQNGPIYLRIGKKGEPLIHKTPPEFKIGQGIIVQPGQDVCLLSTGAILPVVAQAAKNLQKQGISAQVVSLHTVKPLEEALLARVFANFAVVATAEEHSIHGGLGGSVAEWIVDQPGALARLVRFGTNDTFLPKTGDQKYARVYYGLTPEHMAARIAKVYRKVMSVSTAGVVS